MGGEIAEILAMHAEMTGKVLAGDTSTMIVEKESATMIAEGAAEVAKGAENAPSAEPEYPPEYPPEPEWCPPKLKKKKSRKAKKTTPAYGALTPLSGPALQRKGSSSSTSSSEDETYDGQLIRGIINRVRQTADVEEAHMVADKALEIVKELSSVSSFAVAAYVEGGEMKQYQRRAIGKLVASCTVSKLLSIEALLEVLSSLGQDLGVGDKHIAGYAATAVAVDAVKVRHVSKAMGQIRGEEKGTDLVLMLAEELRVHVGKKRATVILNGPGGLLDDQKRRIEWLDQQEHASPEDTDYCPDSRSTSDTE